MRRKFLIGFCLWALIGSALTAAEIEAFPGAISDFHGYERHDFEVAGKPVLVVVPRIPAPGRPWLWHGEFFAHIPKLDEALLARGFHIAYMKIPDMLGAPEAVELWDKFYDEMTSHYGMAKKVALIGVSRGGLYCYNWAEANPEHVACIYGDAPVCDFKSWPGGKGTGPGSERDWKLVLERYGFKDDAEAIAWKKNPVDNLAPLAKAGVPLIHVFGEADEVVPWEENTGLLAKRYRELGGRITLIPKPGVKHHPHGLEDPGPVVDFIVQHASVVPEFKTVKAELLRRRQSLGNFFSKAHAGGQLKVAYLGGSITAANGWRVKSLEWLSKTYPKVRFSEVNAAIGGTGSDLGVFRVDHDALQEHPDLLFVEFAVNDGGAAPHAIWQAMEGIVRQTWKKFPRTDICFVYTFRTGYESDLSQGNCPRAASAMEMLADHYGIPSVNFALEVVNRQTAGKLILQSAEAAPEGVIRFSSDGVHPLDEGHQLYEQVLASAFQEMDNGEAGLDHSAQLERPFVGDNLENAKMVPISQNMLSGEWHLLPEDSQLSKNFSKRMGPIWETTMPGSKLSFKFKGASAQLYDLVGPDGGQVLITVDGKTSDRPIPRFDSYCTYHRIATLSIARQLDPNIVHSAVIEVQAEQPDRSSVAFRLKEPEKELKEPKYQGTKLWASQILVVGDIIQD